MENISNNSFKSVLENPGRFAITWEQVPGRVTRPEQIETILKETEKAAAGNIVDAVSITDNPGGNPSLPAEMVADEVKRIGIEPLVHVALRDKNRIEIESLFYQLAVKEIKNVLVISGDYSGSQSFYGRSQPSFDLDPAHVMELVGLFNQGLEYSMRGKTEQLPVTDFFAGVGVSPFKKLESENVCQYNKLEKKIKAGARFAISQIGYDARKTHELIQWNECSSHPALMIANIYVLSYPAAKAMYENRIPGAVVTRELLEDLYNERGLADKGRAARKERAAKMYAIARGMGYRGVHIGGFNLKYEQLEEIVNRGEELSKNWVDFIGEFHYPQENSFYMFEKDTENGLNRPQFADRNARGAAPMVYRLARLIHKGFFDSSHPLFGAYQKIAAWVDKSRFRRNAFGKVSHLGKTGLFDCLDCGDCALFDLAYLCPVSQCSKDRRLGPCGGSLDGWCEVYPGELKCVWVRAYDRLKVYKEESILSTYSVPPRNWDLWKTPSQLNFYLGRDHTSKRLGIRPPGNS